MYCTNRALTVDRNMDNRVTDEQNCLYLQKDSGGTNKTQDLCCVFCLNKLEIFCSFS